MRKGLITIAAVLLALTASAQEVAKTGLNFAPLPAVSYSSDLGFHYGVLSDVFWYGDGSVYPDYIWKGNVEVSKYTKGNTVLHSFFDSKYLIPGLRFSASISYFGNKTYSFYGFNGASSLYLPEFDKITAVPETGLSNPLSDGLGFYVMRRDIFRVATCLQGSIGDDDSKWGWAGGLTFWGIKTGHAENKGLANTTGYDYSLYDLYVDNGVIPVAEANGGSHLELKAGVVYDSRDHENNPTRGANLEAYFFGSPDILNGRAAADKTNYLKLAVHWKQFFPIVPERLTFGYHLAYQGLVLGRAPFYLLQSIQSINMKQINTEGLGSTCTVRGTTSNRIMGNGYAWMNSELRWTFLRGRWIGQNWALATNPFFDAGMVVQPYRYEEMKAAAGKAENSAKPVLMGADKTYTAADLLWTGNDEKLHLGAGLGLHIIMNQNFNVNFEVAKCFDPNDGNIGINIGLNYIF